MALYSADSRSTPTFSINGRAIASGSRPTSDCAIFGTVDPCASIPTASITESGPRPSVNWRTASARSSSCSRRSSTSLPRARTRSSRSGTRSTPMTRASWCCRDPARHVADRPEAQHDHGPAGRHVRILDRLPRGRQHIGQVDVPLVGRALRHLDVGEVGVRHTQILGLAARDLPVHLRVPEQRRAGAVVAHLRRLALRVELLIAHEAVAARDLERDDDPVARLDRGDLVADFLDDAHRLVPEHVAGVHERPEHFVEVQIGAADVGAGDLDDRVCACFDFRVRDVHVADVAPALPGDCLHVKALPRRARAVNVRRGRPPRPDDRRWAVRARRC